MQTCAALAFAAPIAQPTQAGAKSVQETTTDDGTIDLLLCGYASGFREVDLEGEVMQPQAFSAIKSEWGAAARPPVYYAKWSQEVGRKQDRNIVIRGPQPLDTKVHGGSVLRLIRWRC